jgi:PAS domain S-box-containing protein
MLTQKEKLAKNVFKAVESLGVEGVAILNKEGEYVYANPRLAEMYGYGDYHELLGKSWKTLYSEENVKWIEENMIYYLYKDGYIQRELAGKKKDGTSIFVDLRLALLDDGLFCICKDITNETKIKEQEKANMIQKVIGIIKGDV